MQQTWDEVTFDKQIAVVGGDMDGLGPASGDRSSSSRENTMPVFVVVISAASHSPSTA